MSNIYLETKAKLICIDFFGFPIGIPNEWYHDSFYLAIDANGVVYCYSGKPSKRESHWAHSYNSTGGIVIADQILDLEAYESAIAGIPDWVASIWDKECWPITTFPVLRTA